MKESVWLFLGRWAMVWSLLTLAGGFIGQLVGGPSVDKVDTLGGLVSMVWWVLFALGATNVTSDLGSQQYPGVSIVATVMAGVMFLVMAKGTVYLVDVRDITTGKQRAEQ